MNKRMKTKTLFTAAVVIATVCILTNCGTGKASAAGAGDAYANAPMPKGNNMSTDALSSTIIDWSDRGIGEEENPVWLLKLRRNGDDPIKSELGIPENSIVKVTSAEGSNRNEMRVQADLLFAAQTAQELQQIVKVGAATKLNEGEMVTFEEVASRTPPTKITNTRRVRDFWQQIETKDNGRKTRKYVYYTVFSIPNATWEQIKRKYTYDVVGNLPDNIAGKVLAGLDADIDKAEKRQQSLSDKEYADKIQMQCDAARYLHEEELAKTKGQTVVAATTAGAKIVADTKARLAAMKSGNPILQAVATVTAEQLPELEAILASLNASR